MISLHKLLLTPYRGFTNGRRVFVKGRLVRSKPVRKYDKPNTWLNLMNSYRRFTTREYGNIEVRMEWRGQSFETTTCKEGYFIFEADLDQPFTQMDDELSPAVVTVSDDSGLEILREEVDVSHPSKDCDQLIISDIDDTLMESYVTSFFKIKMLYYTFTKSPLQRKPVAHMREFIRQLAPQDSSVFYVSNSPWNIYDFIDDFMKGHGLPRGPIFLRDYGRQMFTSQKDRAIHKLVFLERIVAYFPDKKFVLIGDSAEKDADYYFTISQKFPEQVRAIFIRDIGITSKRLRILSLAKHYPHVPLYIDTDVSQFLQYVQ